MLDADLSSHALCDVLTRHGHDVVAAGFSADLKQLDDELLFAVTQTERRILATHNVRDFPELLAIWTASGRSHHGCIVSCVPTNAYGEMERRLEAWFTRFPNAEDWSDRSVFL